MSFKKRPIIVVFLLAVFYWHVSAENINAQANNDVQARIYVNHASQHIRARNYERAIESIDAAFNLNINDRYLKAQAYYARSYAYFHLENYDEAFNDIMRSMEFDSWVNSFELLYVIYHRTERYEDALLAINRAIELSAQNLSLLRNRAVVYTDLREFENAFNDINYVLSIEPQSAAALSTKSSIYAFMGEHQEALVWVDKAISIDPNNPDFWVKRGAIYYEMGNLDEALIGYSRAIGFDTRRHTVYEIRGNIFKKLGRTAEALNDFNMAIRLAPNVLRLYHARGILHLEMGNYLECLNDIVEYARLTDDEEVQRKIQRFQEELMQDIEAHTQLKQFAELLERFFK